MANESVEELEQVSENEELSDTTSTSAPCQDSKGAKGRIRKPTIATKTKELIEIIIAIAILVFVFKLKSQGALDNPVNVLGNVLGF